MATDDEWSDYIDELFDAGPDDYTDILFSNGPDLDPYAQELFSDWMGTGFKDDSALAELDRYMWQEYGIDFSDVFDWEDFREWYEGQ